MTRATATTLRHVIRLRRAVLATVLVLVTVAGCGGGSNTDCGIGGCTITFPRTGDAAVSVLGVSARLLGVEEGQARIEVAGQTVAVPIGGETQAQGFTVAVESVTETEVVVRVSN